MILKHNGHVSMNRNYKSLTVMKQFEDIKPKPKYIYDLFFSVVLNKKNRYRPVLIYNYSVVILTFDESICLIREKRPIKS